MSVERQTEVEHLEESKKKQTKVLRLLEQQIAGYGSLAVPPHLIIQKEEAEHELAEIRAKLERLLIPKLDADDSPYIGLKTFYEEDAHLFYGRDALIAQLLEKIRVQQFRAILGPSGSGKSSVVLAGLLPRLRRGELEGSQHWLYLTIKPGARPIDALANALATLSGDLTAGVKFSMTFSETPRALLLIAEALLSQQK